MSLFSSERTKSKMPILLSRASAGNKVSLLQQTKNLCKQYHITPLRRRGQNFLISPSVIDKVITAAGLDKNDTIVEVGAGLGTLTKVIAQHVKRVIAIEIDKKMINVLNNELRDFKNVELVQGDIRRIKNEELRMKNYKIVANLPFNVTGVVLRRYLEKKHKPQVMVVIVQCEVGERIIAQPPKMNLLAASVQFYAHPEIISRIGRNNFWPKPHVDSVILRIVPYRDSVGYQDTDFEREFFQVVKVGFLHSRKYLLNNLVALPLRPPTSSGGRGSTTFKNSAIMKNIETLEHENIGAKEQKKELIKIFKELGLSLKVRAQELGIEEWIGLVKKISE